MKLEPADFPLNCLHRWRHTVYADMIEDGPICSRKEGEEPPITEIEIIKTRLVHVWRLVK